jgi:hypothetical protein
LKPDEDGVESVNLKLEDSLAELLQLVTVGILNLPVHDQSLLGGGLRDDVEVNMVNGL